jgi:exonuclease III
MLLDQLNEYNTDITAIQEVRWTGTGMIEDRDCTVFYSCSSNRHQFGTGVMVNKKEQHVVIGFTPVNERISCLHIRSRYFNCSLINTHVPTEERPDDKKEAFYTHFLKKHTMLVQHMIMRSSLVIRMLKLEKKIYTITLLESIFYVTTVMTLA